MVALDVMGGDLAPKATLKGALRAAKEGIPLLLFGPKELIVSQLNSMDENWSSYELEIFNCTQVVDMSSEPTKAVMSNPNSSLVEAIKSLKSGRAKAFVSAGNSGALLVASSFILGRSSGIERPAIAGFLPTKKSSVLCLDLGANADCRPSYLVQFAQLGVSYLKSIKGVEDPKVAILSNGSEPGKGSMLVKEAYMLLEKTDINFIGNVEPGDLVEGKADILVTDGFSGNILLKTMEAFSAMHHDWISQAVEQVENKEVDSAVASWGRNLLVEVANKSDWSSIGGALLLGVRGNVVVAHGCSDATAIYHAIRLASTFCSKGQPYAELRVSYKERVV